MPSLPKKQNIEIDDHISTETSAELCSPKRNVTPSSTRSSLISKPSSSTRCNCYPHHAEVNNEILRQLYFLKSVNLELLKEVRNIKANTGNEDLCNMVPVLSNLKVPCDTVEELQQIEDVLKISENFKNMVNELCKWGGSSILDFVKRSMGTLITNKLATNYSWLGRRHKQAFCKFSIAAVIVEAAIKSEKCGDKKVAEQEIAMVAESRGSLKNFQGKGIKNWIYVLQKIIKIYSPIFTIIYINHHKFPTTNLSKYARAKRMEFTRYDIANDI
ncbi:uncharacterized protein [Diabrotica undecimpunctata]|uniref:uncharacterized protein n=1 Tax=Diabrotica undecimpunctata TaxID=50387 RepID=UPI003B639DC7